MSKYRAVPTAIDGIRFDSKAEAKRYGELKLMERNGDIMGLRIHPKYPIEVNGKKICTYIADFQYINLATKTPVVEDVKGVKTPVYRLKKKLVAAVYDIEITETGLPFGEIDNAVSTIQFS